jgi:hypothetical protein
MNDSDQRTAAVGGTENRDGGRGIIARQEPALVQFLRLLWRRKLLIAAGTLVPTLLAALLLHLWPQTYSATFVYERPISESEYNVLVRRFYSLENLAKIGSRLQEKSLGQYAQKLRECQTEGSLEKWIRFTASPAYPRRLQTTDPATSEKISAFQAQLLSIEIAGRSRRDVETIAAIVTGNFEHMLPMYAIRNDLKELIRRFKAMAADIEDNRFTLTTDLQEEQARFEKLKGLEGPASGSSDPPVPANEDRLVLQFTDVKSTREFLPLSYQIRAVQSKIIDLQETINSNEDKYNYSIGVLEITNKLLNQVEQSILTPYTVEQFLSFLGEQLLACKDGALADYLKSYMRKTENLVLVNTRAGESPMIYPVSKHLAGRSALVFIVSLMIMIFAAVLLDYQRGQLRQAIGLISILQESS